jgi:uncharacterized protein (TIGR02646 family)
MIKIDKGNVSVPDILQNGLGFEETEKLKRDYDNGLREFQFDSKIYGHKSIKTLLIKIQHKKCCFCERSRPYARECDVEHFRPKGGFQKDVNSPLIQPGYYWLAYTFSNLFYSCKTCNQAYKKNLFPLADETARVRAHSGNLNLEQNLLIHPEFDNPEDHITFLAEVAKPKNNSQKGKITIETIGLNDPELLKERFDYLELLQLLAPIARSGNQSAIKHFKKISKPQSIFSLMVKSNFSDLS